MRHFALVLLIAVTLAACADTTPGPSAPAPAPTVTIAPTVTKTPTTSPTVTPSPSPSPTSTATPMPTATPKPPHPLDVNAMRQRSFPGSDITFEETLAPGVNFQRYVVSYKSDGLKIFALMTVPTGAKPATGWPVIIFNHGFILPTQYRTTTNYVAYMTAFASSGYIVFKSDYRGHDRSEGRATGGYADSDYTVDVLNALSALKQYKDADPKRIGMWGHSMGGSITLRSLVVSSDIKAAVIWSGVVASYPDLLTKWRTVAGVAATSGQTRGWRQNLISEYGSPEANPQFWAAISPINFVGEGVAPVQIHHGTADTTVPIAFSESLAQALKDGGQTVEYYTYAGDDHNLSQSYSTAMTRSLIFFNKYVK